MRYVKGRKVYKETRLGCDAASGTVYRPQLWLTGRANLGVAGSIPGFPRYGY